MKGLLKIILGAGLIGLICWKLPIVEILTLCFYIVIIPLVILSSVGLISSGAMDLMTTNWNEFASKLNDSIKEAKEELSSAAVTTRQEEVKT